MKGSMTEKILTEHLIEGALSPGREIGIRIDQTLTQDATGTMVYLAFESLGLKRVDVELALSYIDHNIIQTDYRNADDHRFLQSSAAKYGVLLSPAGNGVSHHVHRQRFGVPGKTLIGSDSHTTTGGCLGMLAVGTGGLEVAMAMAGKPFFLDTPLVWGIRVEGKFNPFVSGKDVILKLLGEHTAKAGIGMVMEFFGPGVKNMDMAARATIANMAVDMGFTACVFPSDEITRDYLDRCGRAGDFRPLAAEKNSGYDRVTELDLGSVEPMVACPSNPDNVKPAAELGGIDVQQVIVGSSCNGDFRDFMMVAAMVEGRLKHPGVSFEINPGSRETLDNVLDAGGMKILLESGARIHEPGCLGCIGMGQAPASGTNSLRTFPRNFKGRSGTKDDAVYLCSPETAAASALTGRITDPRTTKKYPTIVYPARYRYNMAWFLQPSDKPDMVAIIKGPNIKPFPQFDPMEESIEGEVLLKVGNNISTDDIMPAGNRVLPFRSNIPAISEFVFVNINEDFAKRAREKGGGIVVGGINYGQGSSREHAALAPRFLGIKAKLVKSIARIHKANLVNAGIVPLVFKNQEDYDKVSPGDRVVIRDIKKLVKLGNTEIPVTVGSGEIIALLDVSDRQREILLAGGLLNLARKA